MSENFIRHFVALCGAIIVLLAFFSGYFAGQAGWWWIALGTIAVYVAIYKLVNPGGHH
ncbi:MAG: hypothetical protein WA057_06155 [Candidatus Magasanikiibacteriota bacterium]